MTLSNEPPKFNRHRVKVTFSKGLKELIHACLQKDPNKRYISDVHVCAYDANVDRQQRHC